MAECGVHGKQKSGLRKQRKSLRRHWVNIQCRQLKAAWLKIDRGSGHRELAPPERNGGSREAKGGVMAEKEYAPR